MTDASDPAAVITAFLRNAGEVLLIQRSEGASTFPGRWAAISGYVEDEQPRSAARREIREETGRSDPELVRTGEPFTFRDSDDREWTVHPFLFDCDSRDVMPNEEAAAVGWGPPTEILRRETVPRLWTSYDRVRPTPESIAGDTEHGSAYLSVRALEVLRDEAALLTERGGDPADLTAVAEDLLAARPSMTALRTRINRAMAGADGVAALERAASEGIAAALSADAAAGEEAAALVEGETVLTLSRSGTVERALSDAPERVVVAESRPAREGVGTAERLADAGTEVTLVTDAAVATLLARGDVDSVVVGADTVLRDGSVVNKTGTRGAALAAAREGARLLVATAADKISPIAEPSLEAGPPEAVYDGSAPVTVENPTFDVTPVDLVDGVVTERGLLDAEGVAAVADRHATLADW